MATRKLAKELGFLRQRSQSSKTKSLISNQIFSYLIVIDFESTCWKEKNNYSQEIIEFPAVLLNTSTGEVESEFHTYVQPQEHPILSAFCTELTGITQMQIEAGIPLQICLSRFNRWLQNLQLSNGLVFPARQQESSGPSVSKRLCTFLTWSDWDLGVCLQYECKRKQLHKPDVLNSWIDLRSTYRLFYDRKPKGLNGALQDLGIQFAGREHSGLDDSRNTARLAARMMRDGCMLKITRSLVRTPLMVKPMNGKSTEHNGKERSSTDKEENQLKTSKPSSSKISPRSCAVKSKVILCRLDTEKSRPVQKPPQICQSLISPKTLVKGVTTTLWGSVVGNVPSPHSNSLVLCSTTVGCISDQPNQTLPPDPGDAGRPAQEEEGFLMEAEDRCDSYDGVVLEGDDDVIDYSKCIWKDPDDGDPSGSRVLCVTENMYDPNQALMTSLSTNNMRSQVDMFNNLCKVKQHSLNNSFAVPRIVTLDSNHHKLGHKSNTVVSLGLESFVPGKTSTPYSLFSRPKATIMQNTTHKETPQRSFSVFTDPPKSCRSSSGSFFCTSRKALSTLSTNTSSRSTCSSNHTLGKGGQRITSPLCVCGRRAKRQIVSNGGPNHGRGFYCCPVRRSSGGGRLQKGCEFFKWESALKKRSEPCPPDRSRRPLQRSAVRKSC